MTLHFTERRFLLFWYNCSEKFAPSSNGRTADSGSAGRGSNPRGAAKSREGIFPLPRFVFPG